VGLVGRLTEGFVVPGGLAPGARLAGYQVEEPLGVGGMSAVYRARDERLGRLVALKVLAPALAADGEFRRRFTAESRAAAAVDHPNIIPVYEAGQADGALFIAMRLVTGGDLRRVMSHGPLAPGRAAGFLSPVASALDTAHRAGLVHRDVKPANVLVDTSPDRPEHVYLSDFGISKSTASAGALTGTGHYLGTPEYTSPEQVKGHPVDGRADQYALACVAWQLLTGSVPFQRDQGLAVLYAHLHEQLPPLDALRPDLPGAAGQVLARALAKAPGERYPSCGEFTDALREALALTAYRSAAAAPAVPVPAADAHPDTAAGGTLGATQDIATPGQQGPRPGPDTSPARPSRRRRFLTLTLAGTVLATAAAVTLLLALPETPQPPAAPHGGTPTATHAASGNTTEPAGTPAASATKPATVSVPPAGTLTATLADTASKGVRAMALGPGGILAAADGNGRTYLWNTATGKLTGYLTDPGSKGVAAVAFGSHGTLATGDANGSTYLWNTATRSITLTITDPDSKGVTGVAFGPGDILATGDANGKAYQWDTATGNSTLDLVASTNRGVSCVAFGFLTGFGSDNIMASGTGSGSVSLFDLARLGKIGVIVPGSVLDPGSEGVQAVVFGPGSTLTVGDANGKVYLWDTSTYQPAGTLTDPASKGVTAVASMPGSNSTLAGGDANGHVYLWDTTTQKLTGTITDPASKGVSSVLFGPGGSLAVGDKNGRIYLWRVRRGG
jgi:serine/threonine-protein kinase